MHAKDSRGTSVHSKLLVVFVSLLRYLMTISGNREGPELARGPPSSSDEPGNPRAAQQ